MPAPTASDFDPAAERLAFIARRYDRVLAALAADERADADEAVSAYERRVTRLVSPKRYEQLVAAGLAEPLPAVPRVEVACDCSLFEACGAHRGEG